MEKETGEAITEAQAMYHYLTEHGIKGERLILEGKIHQYSGESEIQSGSDRTGSFSRSSHQSFSCFPWHCYWQEMRMQGNLSHSVQISFLETANLYSQGNSGNHKR